MRNLINDQADGLRRLMASSQGRLVAILNGDFSVDSASVTRNLAAALVRQGKQVLLFDEYVSAAPLDVQRDGRIVLINARPSLQGTLSPFAVQADHILVTLQPNATSIKHAYACIKTLHRAQSLRSLRALVHNTNDATEAQRILNNLMQTCNHYLSALLEPAGWVRADPLIVQAERLNSTVVEAFQSSPASTDFCQIASKLLKWPYPVVSGCKRALSPGMATHRLAGAALAAY